VKAFLGLLLLLGLGWLTASPARAQGEFPDVCAYDAGNLTANCKFNSGFSNWHTFLEDGTAPTVTVEYLPVCHSPDCPSVQLAADDWFVGGIYQQVSGVTPGHVYWANVTILWYDPAGAEEVENLDVVGRSVGIDPYGGADPTSPNVIWGDQYWKSFTTCDYKICPTLQVEAMARSSTITLFVRIEDTWKARRDEFPFIPDIYFQMEERYWIDDVGMIDLGGLAAVTATVTSAGGSLRSNDPEQSVLVEFPPGAVAAPTVISYTYVLPQSGGDMTGMDRFFDLQAAPTGPFALPVTITVNMPAHRPVISGTEGLYWLDGSTWRSSGITTTSRASDTLVSLTDHFSRFGVLGDSERLYLPLSCK
jgi:hypothetical protein